MNKAQKVILADALPGPISGCRFTSCEKVHIIIPTTPQDFRYTTVATIFLRGLIHAYVTCATVSQNLRALTAAALSKERCQ